MAIIGAMVVVAVRGDVVVVFVIVWNLQLTPEQVVGSSILQQVVDEAGAVVAKSPLVVAKCNPFC